ncbi:MAG TPA: TIGR02281 family clan AA aspartic protease [Burkholderiales bacterium]|nr:TIGR02281 family clan AA aspartic protease [Burkholderiales bacterium]
MQKRHFIGLAALLLALPAAATEVGLVGVFPGKAAVLVIDGGAPTTLRIGRTAQGVSVVSADEAQAVIEVDGRRRTLRLGQYASSAGDDSRQKVTLAADSSGNFFAQGQVNGGSVRFLVDTGATMIALPESVADRLGVDYRKAPRGMMQTAAGPTLAYEVKLDEVRLGDIRLQNVDAVVVQNGLGIALLGMSFLNRVEMQREGQSMVLIRRY